MHRILVRPGMAGGDAQPPAAFLKVLRRLPWLSAIPARFIGVGFRAERAPEFARR
jgi:hypothetical protein